MNDNRSRPRSVIDMTRGTGRSIESNRAQSRKKPVWKFTEKASTFILNYDIKHESNHPESKAVDFTSLVSR
jgi:hypothetical protein